MVTSWTPWVVSALSNTCKPVTIQERVDAVNMNAGILEGIAGDGAVVKAFTKTVLDELAKEGLAICKVLPDGTFERIANIDMYPAKPLDDYEYSKAPRYLDSTGYKGRK